MKKDAVICFRLSEELKRALEQIAKVERRSLSSTIENILYDHVKDDHLKEKGGVKDA
ncbi:MAG: hypothetical protein M0P30_07505 [Syntrophorhabdaceae bacterium]|nr:hypothetical protein [Syntrophorhabdaceae bacterium]HOC45045.1 hypothetical protein [Syntrophorhabdaceae bacterium]